MSTDYILEKRPPGASGYNCWSFQYNERDKECRTCPWNISCKTATSQRYNQQMAPTNGPYFQTSTPFNPQAAPQTVFSSSPPQQPQFHQPPHAHPQPQPHTFRWENQQPQQPSGPFQTYPGETVAERLVKNILLKMLEVIVITVANEVGRFLRSWTWPKSG